RSAMRRQAVGTLEEALIDGDLVAGQDLGIERGADRLIGARVADDGDPLGGRTLSQAAGEGNGATQGKARLERVATRLFHFATDEEFTVGEHADRHTRVDQVFTLEAVDEQLFEFRCGLAPGTY